MDVVSKYIPTDATKETYTRVLALSSEEPEVLNILISGPSTTGKTTFIRDCALQIEEASKDSSFSCTGADISFAIDWDADDSFFERLGSAPVVFIDNLEILLKNEHGEQLFMLMLDERERLSLSTICVWGGESELLAGASDELKARLESFDRVEFGHLDVAGRAALLRWLAYLDKLSDSPQLTEDAIEYVAALPEVDYEGLKTMMLYFMTGTDLGHDDTIDALKAEELLAS